MLFSIKNLANKSIANEVIVTENTQNSICFIAEPAVLHRYERVDRAALETDDDRMMLEKKHRHQNKINQPRDVEKDE
jgi:hypothetical protein